MAALGFLGMERSRQRRSGAPCSLTCCSSPKRLVGRDLPGAGDPADGAGFNLMGDGLRDALDPKLKQ